jgi:hypothetical protein
MTKKGMTDLAGIMTIGAGVAIGFVIFIVALTLGGSLLNSFNTGITNGTDAGNILHNGTAGLLQVANQSTNMGLVIGITLILMILIGGLGFFLFRGQA